MRTGPLRTRGARTAILIAVLGMLVLGAAPAWAHSELERSDPPTGGTVAVGRSTLTLWFTEAVSPAASTFELQTSDGTRVPVTVSVSEAGGGLALTGGGFVQVATDPLVKGTYELAWTVLSLDDGHPSRGSVVFGVGARPLGVASSADGLPDAPGLLSRMVDLAALVLVIGALAVSGRVTGSMGKAGDAPRRRARRIAARAAAVAVISGAITPFARTPRGGGVSAWLDATGTMLVATPWGRGWLARELALVVAAVALGRWATGRKVPQAVIRVAGVALAAAVLLESWAGHASTLPGRSGPAVLASALHLVAAGVWAGGLVVLAACLIPLMRRDPDVRGPALASAWRAFSPMAAVATVVLMATGIYESGRHLPDLGSVTSTLYGEAVAAKVLLLAGALTLAGFNTLLVHPALAAPVGRVLGRPPGWSPVPLRRFPLVVAAEAVVLVVALGTAALLTSVPTAREIGQATTPTAPRSANVDGLFVTFEEVPAGPDRVRLLVRARSTVKPERAPVSGVEVVLAGPAGTTTSLPLDPVEPGRYQAETARPAPGPWTASVAVQRRGLPDAVMQARWTVEPADTARAGLLEVVTTAVAVALLAALVGVLGAVRRRTRPAPATTARVAEQTGSRS